MFWCFSYGDIKIKGFGTDDPVVHGPCKAGRSSTDTLSKVVVEVGKVLVLICGAFISDLLASQKSVNVSLERSS